MSFISGFCIEQNPFESLDSELFIPRDGISRVRDLMIKSFTQDFNQISGNGKT